MDEGASSSSSSSSLLSLLLILLFLSSCSRFIEVLSSLPSSLFTDDLLSVVVCVRSGIFLFLLRFLNAVVVVEEREEEGCEEEEEEEEGEEGGEDGGGDEDDDEDEDVCVVSTVSDMLHNQHNYMYDE